MSSKISGLLNAHKENLDKKESKNYDIMLKYEDKNLEVNQLYLTVSKVAKTINFARQSMESGNRQLALMNYHEVAQFYKELANHQKQDICYSNISFIYMNMKHFDVAIQFATQSINLFKEYLNLQVDKVTDFDDIL